MGTVHALARVRQVCGTQLRATKAELLGVLDHVAVQLGNTRSVCRKFYVHPDLQRAYLEGRLIGPLARLQVQRAVPGLSRDETVLLALLPSLAAIPPA